MTRDLVGVEHVAFTPKGGCPLKRWTWGSSLETRSILVAFTPKGGCPLKLAFIINHKHWLTTASSIHPQGWVPVETKGDHLAQRSGRLDVAFTPKGGCPLKREMYDAGLDEGGDW